jgi:hypothetical protein
VGFLLNVHGQMCIETEPWKNIIYIVIIKNKWSQCFGINLPNIKKTNEKKPAKIKRKMITLSPAFL